jgi:hypothetical protein
MSSATLQISPYENKKLIEEHSAAGDLPSRDLAKKQFGKWTVLSRASERPGYWNCQCGGCGQVKEVSGRCLRTGRTKQCKSCSGEAKATDLAGQKKGKWTVIERAKEKGQGVAAFWRCECECGRQSVVRGQDLRAGTSTQCKQCANEEKAIDLTGQKKGKWTVLSQANGRPEYWNCQCRKGHRFDWTKKGQVESPQASKDERLLVLRM